MAKANLKKYIDAGKIVNIHGIAGEIKVQPWSDSPEFLKNFKKFYISPDGGRAFDCQRCRVHKDMLLIKLAGVDTAEQAEKMRGKILYIDRADTDLPEGEYFVQDLIGCEVFDEESGGILGTLVDIMQTGANDVWHIEAGGRVYLVPAIADVIRDVHPEEKMAVIRPLKGIFDDED